MKKLHFWYPVQIEWIFKLNDFEIRWEKKVLILFSPFIEFQIKMVFLDSFSLHELMIYDLKMSWIDTATLQWLWRTHWCVACLGFVILFTWPTLAWVNCKMFNRSNFQVKILWWWRHIEYLMCVEQNCWLLFLTLCMSSCNRLLKQNEDPTIKYGYASPLEHWLKHWFQQQKIIVFKLTKKKSFN